MKFSRKLSSLVTSTVLASVVVTSGATTVLAEESDQGIITFTESQDTTSNEDTKVEETKTDEVVTEEGTVEDGTTEKDADAGLIPGDFFYFVEVMQEKIQLALTFNDYKKSQLLAEIASERIAEANALIQDGKYEEAGELLQKALENNEKAQLTLGDNTEEPKEETVEEGTAEESVEEKSTEDSEGSTETEEVDKTTDEEVVKEEEVTDGEEVVVEDEEVAQVKVK